MSTPIKRGKTYAYGVLLKDSDVMNPQFRYKEAVLPGDVLLDSGIETWEQFWLENPRNEKRTQTHTVYELTQSKNKRTLQYLTEGMFTPPGTYRKRPVAQETLSDAPQGFPQEEPTPLAAYSTPTAQQFNLPEINELIQQTIAAQNDFATEQITLLRSIITDKDKYIEILQKNEKEKIDAAVAIYTARITQLEARITELTQENTKLSSDNAVLKSSCEKLEWQAKEAKKIEEKLQKDFDEATKVMEKGLSDNGPTGILDKLLDRPIDEVIRGIGLLKEMFTGNSTPSQPAGYTQEQLQQLYQQAMRYQTNGMPQAGMPTGAQSGMPQTGMPQGGIPQAGMQQATTPAPQSAMPQGAMPAATVQNPGMTASSAGRPTPGSIPLQTGAQLPETGTRPQYANVQSM